MNKIEEHPQSREIIELILNDKMSSEQGARELDVDPGQLRRYIKKMTEEEHSQTMEMYADGMHAMIQKLGKMINELDGMPVEPAMVKMMTSMTREARGLIRDLADLQKQIASTSGPRNQESAAKYNNLISFLMNNLCGECRMLVGRRLAESEQTDLGDLKDE